MNPLPSSITPPSTPPPASTKIDTSLASTPPSVVCNRYPIGSCWSATSASDVADAAQAFGNQLGSNIPAMRQGGNNYTQVYKGGKVTYVLNMGWVEGCTVQTSQDPNNLMPNDPSADYSWFFNHAFTDCPAYVFNVGTKVDTIQLGGYYVAGCVKIGTYPNAIPGVASSPPKPQLFLNNPTFCS